MRRITSLAVAALIGTLLSGGRAEGQDLAARWRAVPADSASLAELYAATLPVRRDEVLREVLATVADRSAPPTARVHAFAALGVWVNHGARDHLPLFRKAARTATLECPAQGLRLSPGGPLRVCSVLPTMDHYGWQWGIGDEDWTALAVGTEREREMRAVLRCVVRDDPNPAVRSAARFLVTKLVQHEGDEAPRCPPAAAGTPGLARWRAADSLRVFSLLEVNEPPGLERGSQRGIERALARLEERQGTVLLSLVVGRDGTTREVAVVHRSRYPELDAAALRAVEGARFVPARIGGVPVAVRMELPVERVASYWPGGP